MSHSKRNTSRPVFTSYERAQAKAHWSSSSARLTRDSFLPFGSCCLCLGPAQDPVSCPHGDVFCRECALSNLVAQKKEIRRLAKAQEQAAKESLQAHARQDEEAQKRAIEEFEKTQAGLGSGPPSGRPRPGGEATSAAADPQVGSKRKLGLDEGDLERMLERDRQQARRDLDAEKAAAKSALKSFWTPSLTPTAEVVLDSGKKRKTSPQCPVAPETKPHSYSLSSLITLHFASEPDVESKSPRRSCPSCKKALSNTSTPILMRSCGHVLCKGCVDRVMAADGYAQDAACFVCDKPLEAAKGSMERARPEKGSLHPGMIKLRSEGTGFASHSESVVQKHGSVFAC